jgi:biotin synthase
MTNESQKLLDGLFAGSFPTHDELVYLIKGRNKEWFEQMQSRAVSICHKERNSLVWIRGVMHLSSYCKNDCSYCVRRRSNHFCHRYRLDETEMMERMKKAYDLGIRRFTIQAGEDLYFTTEQISAWSQEFAIRYPQAAIEWSLGERTRRDWQIWKQWNHQYMLPFTTSVDKLYRRLHPSNMSLLKRKQSLWELKELEYQLATGFLVGVPLQTNGQVADDLSFLHQLNPYRIEIRPFLPQRHSIYEKDRAGNADLIHYLTALVRIMLPKTVLSITGGICFLGNENRKLALQSGADEINFSLLPVSERFAPVEGLLPESSLQEIEQRYVSLVQDIKQSGFYVK